MLAGDQWDYFIKPCTCCLSIAWSGSVGMVTVKTAWRWETTGQKTNTENRCFCSRLIVFNPLVVSKSVLQSCMSFCLGLSSITHSHSLTHSHIHTHTHIYTQTSRMCVTVITQQGMLGNLVKDVRNVNHLQSVLLTDWPVLPPPEELHWLLIDPALSL